MAKRCRGCSAGSGRSRPRWSSRGVGRMAPPAVFYLRSYEEFPAAMIPVFLGGLFGGAVVLTWVNNHTGGSILAVAVWHALHA